MSAVPKHCPVSNNSGVTLLELMVTVTIIGILSAVALPVCQPLILRYKLNSGTRNLSANLLWARLRAISQQNNFVVRFYTPDTDGDYKYEIFSDDNYNGVRDQEEECRQFSLEPGLKFASNSETISPLGEAIEEADGVTFSENRFTFAPRGSANESGTVYLVPTVDASPSVHHDRSKALTVTSTTGRIRVWKYCPDNTPGPWE